MKHPLTFSTAAFVGLLAACSPSTEQPKLDQSDSVQTRGVGSPAAREAKPSDDVVVSSKSTDAKVLGLNGLGDLRIGETIPDGGSWAERGAQTGDACRTIASPAYPGVYAIVERGKVRRVTIGQRSDVKLAEGIGVGSAEAEVLKWFAGFRAEPHKYEAPPAKYLTAPNAASGDPALRFEIGTDRRVRLIHVGIMPVLGYVEGCS